MTSVGQRVPLIKPDLPSLDDVAASFREVLDSGRVTNFGKYVTSFEREAGAYLGCDVVSVSSGTMGLIFALQALGLRPGEKVVLPSFTFMATAQAVRYAGGVPLFAEINEELTLCPTDLEELLDRHDDVSIVLPVHTYGLACHVDELQQVTAAASGRRSRPIALLYDAAHAFGSALPDGRRVGTFGNAEVFSLSVTKVLVSIEGGLIASRDAELIRRLRKARNYGIEASYDAGLPGLNGKMSELHAIVGLHNLRNVPGLLAERGRKATAYAGWIRESTHFQPTPMPPGAVHTYKDFTVVVPPWLKAHRDAIIAWMSEQGVETRAYFSPPVHQQRFFSRFADRPLPLTENLAQRVITLPFFTGITAQEMGYVVDTLREAEGRFG
jgi:dTDP-4-amino-4,6-dideoxygalactose transaminase